MTGCVASSARIHKLYVQGTGGKHVLCHSGTDYKIIASKFGVSQRVGFGSSFKAFDL
jgi:hypothetical protein